MQLYADIGTAWFTDDKESVSRLLPKLKAHFSDANVFYAPVAVFIAGFCFYLGEREEGFEWLERSYSRKEFGLLSIKSDPLYDRIRTDLRYIDLVKRLGLG